MTPFLTHWQPPSPWTDDKPACFTRAGYVPVPDGLTGMPGLVNCPACLTKLAALKGTP